MKKILLLLLISSAAFAADSRPTIVLAYPTSGHAKYSKDEMVNVVVDKGNYTVNGTVVLETSLVPYLNDQLKNTPSGVICVYLKPDMTFGEVTRSLDLFHQTNAVTVAVSRSFLPPGQSL